MSLYLLVTHACNLACVYCFNGDASYQRSCPPAMRDETADAAVDWALRRLDPHGTLEIVFFGGEPLLRWPLVRRVVDRCEQTLRSRHPNVTFHYHLTSNLTSLPRDLIEVARRVSMTFLCDVDGPQEVHDRLRPHAKGRASHEATARVIRALTDAGLAVSLRATVTSANAVDLGAVVAHHRHLGGCSSALVPLNPIDSDQVAVPERWLADPGCLASGLAAAFEDRAFPADALHPFSEALPRVARRERRRIACGAPYGCTPVVDAAGDLYPCIYFVGIPWLRMENVLAPEPARAHGVLSQLLASLDVDATECRTCGIRYLCSGGCPAMRVLARGRPDLLPMQRYARDCSCAVGRTVTEKLLWSEARSTDQRHAACPGGDGCC